MWKYIIYGATHITIIDTLQIVFVWKVIDIVFFYFIWKYR